jgi:hypothetical protein
MSRKLALVILGIAAVIVVGLLIDSPWSSGGDNHSKASIVSDLNHMLEDHQAPPAFRKCFVASIDKQIGEAEVERAYERMPPESKLGETPITQLPPPLGEKVSRVGLFCLERMMRTGRYSRQEIAQMMLRMGR